jgi:hypothetical protein
MTRRKRQQTVEGFVALMLILVLLLLGALADIIIP